MLKEKYGKNSPSRTHPLTLSFAFSHPAHMWATFFGVGLLRPAPGTWGTVAGAIVYALYAPWLSFAPGLAIMATVLGLTLLGDGMRDVMDPKLQG